MDSTTPATAQAQDASTATTNFDTLAMVTAAAAVANNTNLNMAAALLTAPNPHFLNALNSAFPLYSVAGATNILNAIVATNTAPLQPTVTPQTATAGSSFLSHQSTQQTAFTNLLSTNACSCTATFPPSNVAPQNHSAIQAQNEDRPTPSNFLRSSRKRTLAESGIRSNSSGATRQPSTKYQRVSSSGQQRRPDTPTPIIGETEPRLQHPSSTNLAENFLDSVVSAAFNQQQQEQSAAAMSRAINLNSRNLATAFLQNQGQMTQAQPPQQQQQNQSCPVCHNRQLPTNPSVLSPAAVALQTANVAALQSAASVTALQSAANVALATSSQAANLLPPAPPAAFVLPQTFGQPAPQLQLPTVDETQTNNCMCTGYHCARCNGPDRTTNDDLNSWLSRQNAVTNQLNQPQLSASAVTTAPGQFPNELFALALNRVQQQFSQVAAPVQQAPQRLRYPTNNQLIQQQLSLWSTTVPTTAAALNRSLQHQMTRASSLTGVSPFPAAQNNTHQDHLNLLNRRQQSQQQSNDYINRFYSQNSVVLPPQPQQTQTAPNPVQLQQTISAAQNPLDLQANPIALRAARLAPAAAPTSTLNPYHHANHSSLLLLSNIHNIHHQLAATDMPMIFFPASTNGEYVLGNPEAVTHAVATAMHHAPEPQPVGASSDQIKRCTQIRNYVKDLEVPENERERCTVCLMDFETGEDIRTLHCSHMFHIDCIDRWLAYNKKCPVCRVDMDKVPVLITDNEETLGLAAAAQ